MLKHLLLFVLISYQAHLAYANSYIKKPIQIGDNVISIMRKNGFTESQRETILANNKMMRQMFLTLDTSYLVRTTQETTELRIYDPQTSAAFKVWRSNKNFGAEPITSMQTNIERIEGRIRGSLMASILEKINSNWIASRFMDAYMMDVDLNELERNAKFWLTVEKKYDQGHFVKYGEVTQASLEIDGSMVTKKFIRANGGGVFVSESDLLKSKPFYAPVNYLRFASMFQPNRRHPITKKLQPHLGVDFELPEGAPVLAAKKGTVVRYGRNHAAGNFIVLLHTGGIETSYNHLSKIDKRIRTGLQVGVGEKIAEVGCTGYCTKAHLHFALRKNGKMVDPIRQIKPFSSVIEPILEDRVAKF